VPGAVIVLMMLPAFNFYRTGKFTVSAGMAYDALSIKPETKIYHPQLFDPAHAETGGKIVYRNPAACY
jgi:hypothetical protein